MSACRRFWQAGQLLNTLPVYYCCKTDILFPTRHGPKLFQWWLFYLLYILDLFYLSLASQHVTLMSVPTTEFVNFYVHFISRLVAGILIFLNVTHLHSISIFYNHLSRTALKHSHRFLKDGFVSFAVSLCLVQPVFPLLLHLQSRQSARYWPSQFFPQNIYNHPIFFLMYALLDLKFSYFAIYGASFTSLPIVCYDAFGMQWIKMLR